ncbi:MAG: hypothetical protein OSB47_08815, partial [Pirellulaceae bacterium]|nr:hypothetical protein [Pirellulaceae bacterium]
MRSLAYFPGSFSRHLGLVGMLLLLACNVAQVAAQKAAPQPRHAWKLTAPHLQENKFQASAGTLHGTLLGPARF